MKIAQEEIFGPVACLIPFKRRGGRHRAGERHCLRSVELCVDGEHRQGAPGGGGRGSGHVFRELAERAGPAAAVWGHQGVGHGARGRDLELRGVPGAQERRCFSWVAPHSSLGCVTCSPLFRADPGRDRRSPGYPAPLMSPETGCARFSSFTSLRRVPTTRHPEAMLALNGSSADAQREGGDGCVPQRSKGGGLRAAQTGGHERRYTPSPPSTTTRQPRNDSKATRRQAKWAK
jgi:hypothetical protein